MFQIDDIKPEEILELVTFRLGEHNYTKIRIIRGIQFYAKSINEQIQELSYNEEKPKDRFNTTVKFYESNGGIRL